MKPGWLTSESHLTAGMVLAGVLILSGRADPKDQDSLAGMLDRAITRITGAAAAVLPVLKYLGMRTSLKLRQLDELDSESPPPTSRRPRVRRWQLGPTPYDEPDDRLPITDHRSPDPDPPRAA